MRVVYFVSAGFLVCAVPGGVAWSVPKVEPPAKELTKFNDAPPNFAALSSERQRVETGEADGWRWAKLRAGTKVLSIAPASRAPLVYFVSADSAVHLLSLGSGEVANVATAQSEGNFRDAHFISCSSGGNVYAHQSHITGLPPDYGGTPWSLLVTEVRNAGPNLPRLGVIPAWQPLKRESGVTHRFSPDGRRLAVGSDRYYVNGPCPGSPSSVNVWDVDVAANWQPADEAKLLYDPKYKTIRWESGPIVDSFSVRALAWSPDGSTLAAAGGPHVDGTPRRDFVRDPKERTFDVYERERRYRKWYVEQSEEEREKIEARGRGFRLIVCCWDAITGRLKREWGGDPREGGEVKAASFAIGKQGPYVVFAGMGWPIDVYADPHVHAFEMEKDSASRRSLGNGVIAATFFGADAAVLVVRKGVVSIEDALSGKVESTFDLKSKFGHEKGWKASPSSDSKAVALWHESGIILYKTRP